MFELRHYDYYGTAGGAEEFVYSPLAATGDYGLSDASLSLELNSAGKLDATMPPTHPCYGSFHYYKSEIAALFDGTELWRGFAAEMEVDFEGNKTVTFEGIQAYLNDSVFSFPAGTYTTQAFLSYVIDRHNEQMGDQTNKKFVLDTTGLYSPGSITFEEEQDYDTSWNYIESNLLNGEKGFITVIRNPSDGKNYISYREDSGETDTSQTQTIEFGKNLLDLGITFDTEELFTVLVAAAKSVSGDNMLYASPNPMVNEDAVREYGYIRKYVNFNELEASTDIELQRKLNEEAKKMSDAAGVVSSIEADVIDLYRAGVDPYGPPIALGDYFDISCSQNGVYGTYNCSQISFDLLNIEKTRYTFGNPKNSMTSQHIASVNEAAQKIRKLNRSVTPANILNYSVEETGTLYGWPYTIYSSGYLRASYDHTFTGLSPSSGGGRYVCTVTTHVPFIPDNTANPVFAAESLTDSVSVVSHSISDQTLSLVLSSEHSFASARLRIEYAGYYLDYDD